MAYEHDYFLLFPSFAPGAVMLMPDEQASRRPYLTEELVPGKPLRFSNGFADMLPAPDRERVEDLLFDGTTFGVRDKVREIVERHPTPGLQFYPMIFTDALGRPHHDYFYANLFGERPFLDLASSEVLPGPDDDPEHGAFVLRYAFDRAAMDAVAQEERLLFRLEGVLNANFVVHRTLLAELTHAGITGFNAFAVFEFREGMQNGV